MIPSYFIDDASLLHGTVRKRRAADWAGLVKLDCAGRSRRILGCNNICGIGMYKTFDEFLRLTWGDAYW